MIPTLPNFVPTIGAKPSANHETAKLPAANGKKDESFASLMMLILSPAGFGQPTKGSKPGVPEPGKDHGKTTDAQVGGDPIIDADQTVLPDPNVIVLACPQNVFAPVPVPMAAKADQKSDLAVEGELPVKMTPGISSADLKTELTAEPAKVPSPKTGAKNISERVYVSERVWQADLKVPIPGVSPKPSGVAPVSLAKIDAAETSAPLIEAITSETSNSADNQEATPVPITKPAVSSIPMASPAPTILAKPASAPVEKSADETTVKTVDLKQLADLKLSELAPKTPPAIVATPATIAIAQQVQVESFPPETEVENIGQPAPDASGTSIAKEDAAMKKVDKLNKFAGTTEKILPGNATMMARENPLPARADQPAGNAALDVSTSSTSGRDGMIPLVAADAVAGSAAIDSRSRTLENVHELVVQHAMRLNGAGVDSLQVVIRPGAGTQLSLELRRHGDGVEVQAVLQQGDFNHLNQNWPELQQRLEQRGIRLAPLTGDVNFAAGNGGHAFQQKPNQPAEALVEFTPAFSMAGTFARPAANATTHRGWETWA